MATIIPDNFALRRNPINVEITQSSGGDTVIINGVPLAPEAFNGNVCVDVSALLVHPLQDTFVTDFEMSVGAQSIIFPVFKDKHLAYDANMIINGRTYSRTFLEGFLYIGEQPMEQPNIFTKMERIHCWDVYPRPLAIPFADGYKITIDGNSLSSTVSVRDVTQVVLDIENLAHQSISINDGNNTRTFSIIRHEAPAHPFYVRWVNRFGGWDCWMFECNHADEISTKASTVKLWQKNNDDLEAMETFDTTIERTINVIAGQLTKEDYMVVRELGASPCIQVFAHPDFTSHLFGNVEGWMTVGCSSSSSSAKVASVRNDIEFTFQIPTI